MSHRHETHVLEACLEGSHVVGHLSNFQVATAVNDLFEWVVLWIGGDGLASVMRWLV